MTMLNKKNEEYLGILSEAEAYRNLPWEKAWFDFKACKSKIDSIMSYYPKLSFWNLIREDKKLDKYYYRVNIYYSVWGEDELEELYEKYKRSNDLPPSPKELEELEDVPILNLDTSLDLNNVLGKDLDVSKTLKFEPIAKKEGENEKRQSQFDLHLNEKIENEEGSGANGPEGVSGEADRSEEDKKTVHEVKVIPIYEEPGTDILDEDDICGAPQEANESLESSKQVSENPEPAVKKPSEWDELAEWCRNALKELEKENDF